MIKYAPPGIPLRSEVTYYIVGMVVSTLWTLLFILRYLQARAELFVYENGNWKLMEGAVMEAFPILTENLFELFLIVWIYTAVIAVYHYFYQYQGSKMMYLMRRLPDRWELHRRCLFLPIMGLAVSVLYSTLLKILYYAIYMLFTPSQCLPLPL